MRTRTPSSQVLKGGALLDESRRFVEVWDTTLSTEDNLDRIASTNLLGKQTLSRSEDVVSRLRRRFVAPGPSVVEALKQLTHAPRAFVEACYYESTRDDALLANLVEGPLMTWYEQGRIGVTTLEVETWLATQQTALQLPTWSEKTRIRVAQSLLSTLRDFGILTGRAHKEFAQPNLSLAGFSYVSYRLHETGLSSRRIAASTAWRRWLLSESRVRELFLEADQAKILRFSQAGSSVRIDWLHTSLPGAIHGIV